mgnify:CR=1 FL=1
MATKLLLRLCIRVEKAVQCCGRRFAVSVNGQPSRKKNDDQKEKNNCLSQSPFPPRPKPEANRRHYVIWV